MGLEVDAVFDSHTKVIKVKRKGKEYRSVYILIPADTAERLGLKDRDRVSVRVWLKVLDAARGS